MPPDTEAVEMKRSETFTFAKPGAALGDIRRIMDVAATDDAKVKVRVFIGGGVRSLTVEWETDGGTELATGAAAEI